MLSNYLNSRFGFNKWTSEQDFLNKDFKISINYKDVPNIKIVIEVNSTNICVIFRYITIHPILMYSETIESAMNLDNTIIKVIDKIFKELEKHIGLYFKVLNKCFDENDKDSTYLALVFYGQFTWTKESNKYINLGRSLKFLDYDIQ